MTRRGTDPRDNDVRDGWNPVKSVSTADRVLPNRGIARALFRRDPRILSFDIFGFALEPVMLESDDLHRLVASVLQTEFDDRPLPSPDGYLSIRRLAEERAQLAAPDVAPGVIGMPAVREQLAELLGREADALPGAERRCVATAAIRTEIQLHGELWQANPIAAQLYRDAIAAGVDVAFLADSPLPRDLVAKLLQRAGYREGAVLVSSQEGATKASGRLYATLADRVGEEPGRITHLGPDRLTDGAAATAAGVRSLPVVDERRTVKHRVVAGLVDRTGVDAVALALAADRLAAAGPEPELTDVGYYAAGPLAAGFGAWIAGIVDDDHPDHVLVCGPGGRLIRHVVATLRPPVGAELQELGVDTGELPAAESIGALATELDLQDGDRLLAVGTGSGGNRLHLHLQEALRRYGLTVEVAGAYLAAARPAPQEEAISVWTATGPDGGELGAAAGRHLDGLTALLAPLPVTVPGSVDGPPTTVAATRFAAGVVQFAEDLAPWLARLPDDCSQALAEPALNLVASPTFPELELLATMRGPWRDRRPVQAHASTLPVNRWRRRPPAKQRSPQRAGGRRP